MQVDQTANCDLSDYQVRKNSALELSWVREYCIDRLLKFVARGANGWASESLQLTRQQECSRYACSQVDSGQNLGKCRTSSSNSRKAVSNNLPEKTDAIHDGEFGRIPRPSNAPMSNFDAKLGEPAESKKDCSAEG